MWVISLLYGEMIFVYSLEIYISDYTVLLLKQETVNLS